uniref:BZIP domain-containing protein n=1 Tax=Physcomitrium patens TaxID=3218 RepID=A0A7I4CD77_PHYPA
MEGAGKGFDARFVGRVQSEFGGASGVKGCGSTPTINAAAHPPHPTQSQLHQSRYVGYPSTPHPFTVKREASPSVSESSMRSRESYSVEASMQDAVTSPSPASVSGSGQGRGMGSLGPNFSTDVNQMPDTPPRRRGHRRAQSESAFRVADDASFESEGGVQGSEIPTVSDDGAEDLFSMYIDMEQINSLIGTSEQAGAMKSGGEGDNAPPPPGHHARSLSVDGGLGNLTGNRTGVGVGVGGGGGSGSMASEGRRARHQHVSSMDGSSCFKHDLFGEFGGDTKKVVASAKLSEIALVDPKRAKRILANRQSAARSKERKVRYISELERKVQGLQAEAKTLCAQLAMLQKETGGLATENGELKLRLQAMEQQAHLRDGEFLGACWGELRVGVLRNRGRAGCEQLRWVRQEQLMACGMGWRGMMRC